MYSTDPESKENIRQSIQERLISSPGAETSGQSINCARNIGNLFGSNPYALFNCDLVGHEPVRTIVMGDVDNLRSGPAPLF